MRNYGFIFPAFDLLNSALADTRVGKIDPEALSSGVTVYIQDGWRSSEVSESELCFDV